MPVLDAWFSAWAYADAVAATCSPPALWQLAQHRRLLALLDAARNGSPWWRGRLRHADRAAIDSAALLRSLPPTTKPQAMAAFDGWVTDPALALPALREFARREAGSGEAFLGRYHVWESSGSRGEPALFVHDARSLAVADALEAARGPLAGHAPGLAGARIAYVGAVDGPYAGIVSLQRLRRLNPWAAATTRPFSFLQPIDALVAELNAWQPAVVATYPSMAGVLAQQQRCGALRLALAGLWCGGETLGRGCRAAVAEAFGCRVRSSYGASECLAIANECAHGVMHANADWAILEPVDAELRPVPPGEAGATTLLTHLANHVQPIIRHDLGDRVRVVPGRCGCGSTLPMIEVEGRSDDVITLHGRDGREVHLPPLALTGVLEEEAGVFDFRLVRTGPQALRLDLFGADAGDGAAAVRVLRAYLGRQGIEAVRIAVQRLARAPERGRSGKLRRIVDSARDRAAA